jgi:hypothetical protein
LKALRSGDVHLIVGHPLYSQAEISRWLVSFTTGVISCLDGVRPGRLLSILEQPLENLLENFPFASARIISMHFNVLHSTVKDILSRKLGLRKFIRRWLGHQLSGRQKSYASALQSSYLRCWINIPSCSSKELQSMTSHGFVTGIVLVLGESDH